VLQHAFNGGLVNLLEQTYIVLCDLQDYKTEFNIEVTVFISFTNYYNLIKLKVYGLHVTLRILPVF